MWGLLVTIPILSILFPSRPYQDAILISMLLVLGPGILPPAHVCISLMAAAAKTSDYLLLGDPHY